MEDDSRSEVPPKIVRGVPRNQYSTFSIGDAGSA
jgi:hypothetical protein